jgi:lysophospholipase L1-like esterase
MISTRIAFALLALAATASAADPATAPAPAAVSATAAAPVADDTFAIHDGDRPVLFIGDSITEQRMYTALVETWTLGRFPAWKLTFRNLGWSGDTAWLQQRGAPFDAALKRDFLDHHPAFALIDYGMNDARSAPYSLDRYRQCLDAITGALQSQGARVAILTPSPEERYEAGQPGGSAYNHALATYGDAALAVAAAHHALAIDQFHPVLAAIAAGRDAKVLGAAGDPRLIPDGVHPNWAGHLLMASAILHGLHAPPARCTCTIDIAAYAVTDHAGCTVDLAPVDKASTRMLDFTRTDDCLPWGVPDEAAVALAIPGATPVDGLQSFRLAVVNLDPGDYELSIDDEVVTHVSATACAAGLDLARLPWAGTFQARRLLTAVQDKNDIFYARWRQVQLWQPPSWLTADSEPSRQAELARLDAKIVAAEAAIDALRQPAPHRFAITPTPPPRPLALTVTATGTIPIPAGPGSPDKQGSGVYVSWHAAPTTAAATVFVIERSATAGGPFTEQERAPAACTSVVDCTPGATTAFYRVRALAAGRLSRPTPTASATWPPGLFAQYFAGTGFDRAFGERIDAPIAFDWSSDKPIAGLGTTQFSVRWCGTLQPPAPGVWTIYATTDDGVRVWLDGKPAIDQWRPQAPTTTSATFSAVASGAGSAVAITPVELTMDYFQGDGGAMARLEWSGPGVERSLIPATALRPARPSTDR